MEIHKRKTNIAILDRNKAEWTILLMDTSTLFDNKKQTNLFNFLNSV